MVDKPEEILVIIWGVTWIRKGVFFKNMVAVELLMEETMSESRVYCSFQESSDQKRQGPNFYIHKTKSTSSGVPKSGELRGLKKQVLEEPRFD